MSIKSLQSPVYGGARRPVFLPLPGHTGGPPERPGLVRLRGCVPQASSVGYIENLGIMMNLII